MGASAPVHESIVSEKAAKRMRGTRTGRRLIAAAGFIGALAAGVIGFVVIGGAGSRPPLLSTYTFAAIRSGRLDESIVLHGTLRLEGSRPLIAPQGGVVEEVFVKEGEEIGKGGRIARISSEALELAIRDAWYELERKRREFDLLLAERPLREAILERTLHQYAAEADLAAESVRNAASLREIGGVSLSTMRSLEADRQAALDRLSGHRDTMALEEIRHKNAVGELSMEIERLENELARSKEGLALCDVRSPVSGRIAKLSASRGAYINRYETIAVIEDVSSPVVLAPLPDRYLDSVPAGFGVTVDIAGEELPAFVAGFGGEVRAEGAGTGSVLDLRIVLKKNPEWFLEGMPARVTLVLGVRENALSLPRGPFFATGSERYVYRIEGNRGIRTEVGFGLVTETEVEVLEGLEAGDRIITSEYTEFIDRETVELDAQGGAGQ